MTQLPEPTDSDRAPSRSMTLMHVFRDAARNGDARQGDRSYREGDRDIALRARHAREGAGEAALRANLAQDIGNLMNTIRLDASADLADAPYVARSVINFGFADMSRVSRSHEASLRIADSIRQSLITHEPRLIPASIEVRIRDREESSDQRLSFDISAEMRANPADIPLDFVAEVDLGAGKLRMTRLQAAT